jgi:hypothetical protein
MSRRPTISVMAFQPAHLQEVIHGVFIQNGLAAIDIETLIFFVMKTFDVTPETYLNFASSVRRHILANYALEQGAIIPHMERHVRRLNVCYTVEKGQE